MFGVNHEKKQREITASIIEGVAKEAINNPLPKMWRCIIVNVISQIFNLTETLCLVFLSESHCSFSAVNIKST